MFFFRYFFLVIFQIILFLGCSAANLQEFSFETPAQILNPVGMPSVKDGRARFREIFCKLLSEVPEYQDKAGHCENYLTRLSDERIFVEQFRQLPYNNRNLRILIVPGLLFSYDLLRNIDPRNDGQVIFYDQVIPGASLLGYINLDHWAIAAPVKEKTASSAWEAAATHPHVRAMFFKAMILFLLEKLAVG